MSALTLIINARLLDPATGMDAPGEIMIEAGEEGQILDLGPKLARPKGAALIDAGGHALCPGLIDLRVVIGEPGAESRETFKSAGRAAATGGVTTLVQMPNTDPVIDDQSLVDFVLRRAQARTGVRILPAAALTRGLEGAAMTEIGLLAEAGAAFFTNADRPITDSRLMRRAMAYAGGFGALIAHRPEDPALAAGGAMHEGELSARMGLPGIPAAAEAIMLARDLALAELTGARLLVDMISCADSVARIAAAKAKGTSVFASVGVHHLGLNEHDVFGYRTFAKLTPPLRTEDDRLALIAGLEEGVIDVIVSGHDPRPAEDKRLPFDEAAPGAAALETLLPGALIPYHAGQIALLPLLAALTSKPAALLGLPQGRLRPGAPADVILVDLGTPFVMDADKLQSKSRNSPYDGKTMQGKVLRTFVGGKEVFAA
jgi:dihydroorotase